MSIASEIERLQNAKTSIKTAISNKGVDIPDTAKLDAYNTYIEQIETGGGGITQINEQLSSQVIKLRIAPSAKGTVKLQWEIPNDSTYAGADISWAKEGVPTFPISEDNIISVDSTENSVTIEGLEEDVLYGFIVMAKNGNGTRNTTTTSKNTVLGYVSEKEVFYEVDIPSELTGTLEFVPFSESNLIFVSCQSNVTGSGCYVLKNGTWNKIIETGYRFTRISKGANPNQFFISCGIYSSPGCWFYDSDTNICTQFDVSSSEYNFAWINLDSGIALGSPRTNANKIYKYDYTTGIFVKTVYNTLSISSYSQILYENSDYAIIQASSTYSVEYSNLYRYDKNTDTFTLLFSSSNQTSYWRYIDNKFMYIASDFVLNDKTQLNSVAGGIIYLFNESTGTVVKCIDTTAKGKLVFLNEEWLYITDTDTYKFNDNTKMFELVGNLPIGASSTNAIQRLNVFDNTLFYVEITILTDVDYNTAGLYKWNNQTNTFDLLCSQTETVSSVSCNIYNSGNTMFVEMINDVNYDSIDVIVYDKTTKTVNMAFAGDYHRLFVGTKDRALLVYNRYSGSGGTIESYIYNPITKAFDIVADVLNNIKINRSQSTPSSSLCNIFELSNGEPIFNFVYSTYNRLYTYTFDKNGNLKKILSTDTTFHTSIISENKDYFYGDTSVAYYYDEETETLVADEHLGGVLLSNSGRKVLYKSTNIFTVYDEERITEYSNLEGDYTSATTSADGYAYSSTSRKVLIAFN